MLLICSGAIWKGGWEERLAAIFFMASLATPLLKDHRWAGTQWALFGLDAAYFLLLLVLAMRTTKYWPICAAGFQLLAMLTHAASMIDRKLGAWAYVTAGVIWTFLVLFSIGIGAWNSWRDRRQLAAATDPWPDTRR